MSGSSTWKVLIPALVLHMESTAPRPTHAHIMKTHLTLAKSSLKTSNVASAQKTACSARIWLNVRSSSEWTRKRIMQMLKRYARKLAASSRSSKTNLSTRNTWAKMTCEQNGSVDIHNLFFLLKNANSGYERQAEGNFVSLGAENVNSVWKTADGSSDFFTQWISTEPNMNMLYGGCADIIMSSSWNYGKMADNNCNFRQHFSCRVSARTRGTCS